MIVGWKLFMQERDVINVIRRRVSALEMKIHNNPRRRLSSLSQNSSTTPQSTPDGGGGIPYLLAEGESINKLHPTH